MISTMQAGILSVVTLVVSVAIGSCWALFLTKAFRSTWRPINILFDGLLTLVAAAAALWFEILFDKSLGNGPTGLALILPVSLVAILLKEGFRFFLRVSKREKG